PVLVTLPLRVNSLVGIERAPRNLALVAGIGALVAMFGNPFFGRMSDRTASRLGMRWCCLWCGSALSPVCGVGPTQCVRLCWLFFFPFFFQPTARRLNRSA